MLGRSSASRSVTLGFVGLALLLNSCINHVPAQVMLNARHALLLNGLRQTCSVLIRSDKGGASWLDVKDETSLEFMCDGWTKPERRYLQSDLVWPNSATVYWLESERAVLAKVSETQDFAGKFDGYLRYDFENRKLTGTLYGLPREERCQDACYWDLKSQADQLAIAQPSNAR
jgi:hypothetical protein